MHNNYYFLRQLSPRLVGILNRAAVSECFSQNKDELIVRFETETGSFFIKANLVPALSCLTFTENFQRARKNSIDLFEELPGQRVLGVRQFENERSFAITLTNNLSLLFKMHGTRSNVIVCREGVAVSLFKKNLVADVSIRCEKLDRRIDWSFESFREHHDDPLKIYFTFGKVVWQYLKTNGYHDRTIEEKWEMITQVKSQLENPTYRIANIDNTPVLSLLDTGDIIKEFKDPLKAANEFFYYYTQVNAFVQEKKNLLSHLHSSLQSSRNYYKKTSAKLKELEDDNNYKIWADIIMANLHQVSPGSEKVILNDFYHNDQPIEIKLKKDLTPQKNAEVFYKKSRNQKIQIDHLQKALAQKKKAIAELEQRISAIEQIEDLKSLRKLKSEIGGDETHPGEKESLPYHEFVHNGFRIWVGRNAQSNDLLTLKFAYKEDLWLHAKDVPGSHVIIKYQAGKAFPKDVVERAAQLAAYNSKRKTETLCPVTVTPKKFVRKRKGDPPGTVIIEREDVVMVEPKL